MSSRLIGSRRGILLAGSVWEASASRMCPRYPARTLPFLIPSRPLQHRVPCSGARLSRKEQERENLNTTRGSKEGDPSGTWNVANKMSTSRVRRTGQETTPFPFPPSPLVRHAIHPDARVKGIILEPFVCKKSWFGSAWTRARWPCGDTRRRPREALWTRAPRSVHRPRTGTGPRDSVSTHVPHTFPSSLGFPRHTS